MFLACRLCSTAFSPIGTPHPVPDLCPQCAPPSRCARCLVPGPVNPRGLCIWCALSPAPTVQNCERCGYLEEAPGEVVDGRCVDAAGCEEHRELWGEAGTSGEQYAGAVEP